MKVETIASVGATVIALLALVASQFPPLYTFFQTADVKFSLPGELIFRCSKNGVFVSTHLPIQNTGDDYAQLSSITFEVTNSVGVPLKEFDSPLVQSDQVDTFSKQPVFVAFDAISVAPSEQVLIHAVFHPRLDDTVDVGAFRRITQTVARRSDEHFDIFGYEGESFTIDENLAYVYHEVLEQQNEWVFKDKSEALLRVTWVNPRGETFSEEQSFPIVLSKQQRSFIQERFEVERLMDDPGFFVGCNVPVHPTKPN